MSGEIIIPRTLLDVFSYILAFYGQDKMPSFAMFGLRGLSNWLHGYRRIRAIGLSQKLNSPLNPPAMGGINLAPCSLLEEVSSQVFMQEVQWLSWLRKDRRLGNSDDSQDDRAAVCNLLRALEVVVK